MDAIPWPAGLRVQARTLPYLENTSRSGGVNAAGAEQTILTPYGRWALSLGVLIKDRATLAAYAAFMARLRWGRGVPVLVPVGACLIQPGARTITDFIEADAAHTLFDDTTGFVEDSVVATLAEPADLNAVSLLVSCTTPLAEGVYVGLGDRFHQVVSVEAAGAALWRVTIAPWTRQAWPAGAALLFRLAVCRMRLKAEHASPVIDLNRFAAPTLDFLEVPEGQ